MRRILSLVATLGMALTLAAPAAAAETFRWTDTDEIHTTFSCGVVENTTATIDGTAYFHADGTWLKDIIRFSYAASFTDPASGRTVEFKTRQTVEARPAAITLRGQGVFIRVPGEGAVLLDVGRLVVDPSDGSTIFQSAHALGLDDPTVPERYDAAICSLF